MRKLHDFVPVCCKVFDHAEPGDMFKVHLGLCYPVVVRVVGDGSARQITLSFLSGLIHGYRTYRWGDNGLVDVETGELASHIIGFAKKNSPAAMAV